MCLPTQEKDQKWKNRPKAHLLMGFNDISKEYKENIGYGFLDCPRVGSLKASQAQKFGGSLVSHGTTL